jgi:hypothetical protein
MIFKHFMKLMHYLLFIVIDLLFICGLYELGLVEFTSLVL